MTTRVRKFGDKREFEAPADAPCAACWLVREHVSGSAQFGVIFVETLDGPDKGIRRCELLGLLGPMRMVGCESVTEHEARAEIARGASQ